MERIPHIITSLNAQPVRIIEPGERARAAVALILEETPHGLNVLLIERSANVNDYWSGHIALPGGRRSATVARETRRNGKHVKNWG